MTDLEPRNALLSAVHQALSIPGFAETIPTLRDINEFHEAQALRAVLTVSNFSSWLTELKELGANLKPHPTHSWHIEVYDKQVGYLGKFRQSRVTGLWFQGKHSIHMLGN
ncbi:hypothetical protein [Rubritalea sp.]|uniref:hypothetical protein n=1 Tax=Rubritalea sp. TaxID=2109375 RepID=UPI003EF64182